MGAEEAEDLQAQGLIVSTSGRQEALALDKIGVLQCGVKNGFHGGERGENHTFNRRTIRKATGALMRNEGHQSNA